eukprot:Gregarina_sp_Poly_1__9647@NODE_610_length_7151_cov_94_603190_g466_i0_p1_GENE_NODE_610_length_7151_cov_94_603190_g466_i0NODE_610_length_7151_cov_94_603190_g466_i0_p1_ORF_typecomplete_len1360_score155_57_NODE_610_length_7151_cov_94_603190_g466_i09114990
MALGSNPRCLRETLLDGDKVVRQPESLMTNARMNQNAAGLAICDRSPEQTSPAVTSRSTMPIGLHKVNLECEVPSQLLAKGVRIRTQSSAKSKAAATRNDHHYVTPIITDGAEENSLSRGFCGEMCSIQEHPESGEGTVCSHVNISSAKLSVAAEPRKLIRASSFDTSSTATTLSPSASRPPLLNTRCRAPSSVSSSLCSLTDSPALRLSQRSSTLSSYSLTAPYRFVASPVAAHPSFRRTNSAPGLYPRTVEKGPADSYDDCGSRNVRGFNASVSTQLQSTIEGAKMPLLFRVVPAYYKTSAIFASEHSNPPIWAGCTLPKKLTNSFSSDLSTDTGAFHVSSGKEGIELAPLSESHFQLIPAPSRPKPIYARIALKDSPVTTAASAEKSIHANVSVNDSLSVRPSPLLQGTIRRSSSELSDLSINESGCNLNSLLAEDPAESELPSPGALCSESVPGDPICIPSPSPRVSTNALKSDSDLNRTSPQRLRKKRQPQSRLGPSAYSLMRKSIFHGSAHHRSSSHLYSHLHRRHYLASPSNVFVARHYSRFQQDCSKTFLQELMGINAHIFTLTGEAQTLSTHTLAMLLGHALISRLVFSDLKRAMIAELLSRNFQILRTSERSEQVESAVRNLSSLPSHEYSRALAHAIAAPSERASALPIVQQVIYDCGFHALLTKLSTDRIHCIHAVIQDFTRLRIVQDICVLGTALKNKDQFRAFRLGSIKADPADICASLFPSLNVPLLRCLQQLSRKLESRPDLLQLGPQASLVQRCFDTTELQALVDIAGGVTRMCSLLHLDQAAQLAESEFLQHLEDVKQQHHYHIFEATLRLFAKTNSAAIRLKYLTAIRDYAKFKRDIYACAVTIYDSFIVKLCSSFGTSCIKPTIRKHANQSGLPDFITEEDSESTVDNTCISSPNFILRNKNCVCAEAPKSKHIINASSECGCPSIPTCYHPATRKSCNELTRDSAASIWMQMGVKDPAPLLSLKKMSDRIAAGGLRLKESVLGTELQEMLADFERRLGHPIFLSNSIQKQLRSYVAIRITGRSQLSLHIQRKRGSTVAHRSVAYDIETANSLSQLKPIEDKSSTNVTALPVSYYSPFNEIGCLEAMGKDESCGAFNVATLLHKKHLLLLASGDKYCNYCLELGRFETSKHDEVATSEKEQQLRVRLSAATQVFLDFLQVYAPSSTVPFHGLLQLFSDSIRHYFFLIGLVNWQTQKLIRETVRVPRKERDSDFHIAAMVRCILSSSEEESPRRQRGVQGLVLSLKENLHALMDSILQDVEILEYNAHSYFADTTASFKSAAKIASENFMTLAGKNKEGDPPDLPSVLTLIYAYGCYQGPLDLSFSSFSSQHSYDEFTST